MKIIGLMPVRNEAWVLRHSIGCLSRFCDEVIVSDQRSEDESRDICRQFANVRVLESSEDHVCERARWDLLDAAREHEGCNLLWWMDADELVSPRLARAFVDANRSALVPGRAIECLFYHLWGTRSAYRDDQSMYRPHWKAMAFVDDRRIDFDRSLALPLHEPRVPSSASGDALRADDLPVFHLQWLLAERNQMKQAWYRCREWMEGGKTAAEINRRYAIALPAPNARTTPVPSAWVDDLTFPDARTDTGVSWQERDLLRWFAERGVEHFEPLEIWHVAALRKEFCRRTGREPRPDRSYRPRWSERARALAWRAARAARRRLALSPR